MDDTVAAFAAAHLRDRTSRAVYLVVTTGRTRWWTSAGVARHTRTDPHEVDQELRRFAAAGIVEPSAAAGRATRYRWRNEMDYLLTLGPADGPGDIDPECGMPVPAGTPHELRAADGTVTRFCSLPCLLRFRRRHRTDGHRRARGRTTEPVREA